MRPRQNPDQHVRPEFEGIAEQPRRVVNRRFGNNTFARRIIEERLVFVDILDPATLS